MSVQEASVNGRQEAESEFVQYEVADGVATLWLNRPEVKNCVNWGLLTQLGAALERADEDDDARVVLIRGRGQTFCAGADLNMLDSEFLRTTNNSVKIAQVSARTFDRAFNLGKPTIAVVEVVVGREHQLDVLQAQALASQAVLERGQGAVVARTGVDQRQGVPAQEPRVHGANVREGKLDVHDATHELTSVWQKIQECACLRPRGPSPTVMLLPSGASVYMI